MNADYNKITALAHEYENYTAENLSELVQAKSLSCHEDKVAEVLKRQMLEARFDEVFTDGLGNVIGRIGKGKRILAFDGHIDTVDIGNPECWTFDPLSGEIRDGYVHGRGSADQKGGVAAFVTAGKILKDLNFKNDDVSVFFIGSVMEEDCDGLCWKYIIEEDKIIPELVVSTEPTNLNIYRGQRGRMEIEITFTGKSAHGSAPERGINAIYNASKVCLDIEKLNEHLAVDDFLGKGSVTVSEFISNSPSLCAVADYAKIHLDRRLTWGETKETAMKEIKTLIQNFNAKAEILNYKAQAYTGLSYGMEKYYPTWKIEENHTAINLATGTFEKLFDKKPKIGKWTFSTNGVVINGLYGIPVIGFGPGDEVFAHAPDEKIPVLDLVAASAFYAAFAMNF